MCLALPGKIIAIHHQSDLLMAKVDFDGVQKTICLAYTPEAKLGDYVIVHVGFSISILNEENAHSTLNLIKEAQNEIRG
ncbi:MAG: HypC/HybG/HupF family hydrogenase formation chaperone [Gammaproteobacteria bacterium]